MLAVAPFSLSYLVVGRCLAQTDRQTPFLVTVKVGWGGARGGLHLPKIVFGDDILQPCMQRKKLNSANGLHAAQRFAEVSFAEAAEVR